MEDELRGDGNRCSFHENLATAEKRLETIKQSIAELEADAREKTEWKEAGQKEKAVDGAFKESAHQEAPPVASGDPRREAERSDLVARSHRAP